MILGYRTAQASRNAFPWGPSEGSATASVLLVYAAAHAALRLSFSGNFATDDAQAVLYLSQLRLVYTIYQPPLYEWLLWGFQQVFGISMVAALALKGALLGAAAFFLYQTARLVGGNRSVAAITVLAWSLFYQVGWNLLEGATHTSMVLFSASMTLYALLKAIAGGRVLSYCLFTAGVAVGMLSKFSYPVFLIALIVTVLLTQGARTRLRLPFLALALATGCLASAPYFLAILSQEGAALALAGKMNRDVDTSLAGLLIGPQKTFIAYFLYSLAFLPVFALFFARDLPLKRIWKGVPASDQGGGPPFDGAHFCLRLFFVCGVIVAFGAFVFGLDNIKERHLHPFFLPLPIALFAMLPVAASTLRKFRPLRLVILIVAVGIFAVRFVTLAFPDEAICGRCRERIPYEGLAEALKHQPGVNLIIAEDLYTAANLKRLLPGSTIINPLINREMRGEIDALNSPQACLLITGPESTSNQDEKSVVTIPWRGLGGATLERSSRWSVKAVTSADGVRGCLSNTKPEE